MPTKLKISSGDQVSTASPALIPNVLCCAPSTNLTVGQVLSFEPGDDVVGITGGGIGADAIYYLLAAIGGTVRATIATPTWTAAPSVTKVGSGPSVTCALTNGAPGCYDDHTITATVTAGGPNGLAKADITYDGSTVADSVIVPAEIAGSLIGTVDLTGVTLSTLNATTLVLTAPAALTTTFTTPTSVEDIAAQINAAAVGASVAVHAEILQDTAGTKKLRLYTTTFGASVSLTIDAPTSTGEAFLGFSSGASNLTTTGAAATLPLPFTGLTLTFPAGTYVKGDVYKIVCTGPRASLSALTAAATAAKDAYKVSPFGFLVVGQPSDSASNCAATEAALSALTAGWLADTSAPITVTHVVGTPFHVASATKATNDANIATADAALLAAFSSVAANLDNVAGEDVYLPGASTLRNGSFRRTGALAWAAKRGSSSKVASDVGEGLVPQASLLGPDLKTQARDEAHSTTKLGGGAGPGFSVLKSTSGGLSAVKFAPGATRAGSSSRLRYCGPVGVALEIGRLVFGQVELWEALTLPTDPTTGRLDDGEKEDRQNILTDLLQPFLLPTVEEGQPDLKNVSAFTVTIDNSQKLSDTNKIPVNIRFVPLGENEETDVNITALGTISVSAA